MTGVRKAVIPAAGLGTRLLPATKSIPKEMLPVVDRPAIQYAVEEAARAGIRDVCLVTSRGKSAMEDHFDRHHELEAELAARGKGVLLERVRAVSALARVHAVRQPEPLGLGHAVAMARDHVGDEAFAVLLPDDLFVDDARLLRRMLDAHGRLGGSVLALIEVGDDEIGAYGAAVVDDLEAGIVRVRSVVEKPPPGEAPSNLAVIGRYVLTPGIFDALGRITPGAGGELQLTDGVGLLLDDEPVYGCVFESGRYDVGRPAEWLRANVELALVDPDLGPAVRAMLDDLLRAGRIGT